MNINFLSFLLVLLPYSKSLLADDEKGKQFSLSALEIEYKENQIDLLGDINIKHPSAALKAEKGRVFRKEGEQGNLFSEIQLENKVSFSFNKDSHLNGDEAVVKLDEQEAKVKALENSCVNYRTLIRNKDNVLTPLYIEAQEFICSLQSFNPEKKDVDVKKIVASGFVKATYGTDFLAQADQGEYTPESKKILLYQTDAPCQLEYQNHCLKAHKIEASVSENMFLFYEGDGSIKKKNDGSINFSYSKARWNKNQNTIDCSGYTLLEMLPIGKIRTTDSLHMLEKNGFYFFICKGAAQFQYAHKGKAVHMNCDGLLIFNQKEQKCTLTPILGNKKSLFNYSYDDSVIEGTAFEIAYQTNEGQTTPTQLKLKGPVYFSRRETSLKPFYGIAAEMDFDYSSSVWHLKGHKNQKVLFYDKTRKLSMTADEIILKLSSIGDIEHIQGVGLIKLSFKKEELKILNNSFPSFEKNYAN